MVRADRLPSESGTLEPQFTVAPWRGALPEKAEWQALAGAASEPNPFFEEWFLRPSLDAFDPGGKALIASLRVDDRLVGLLPIHRAANYYGHPLPHWSIWLHDNAFCCVPLIAQGYEAVFWSTLLNWIDRHGGNALFVHLPGLPENSAPAAALAELLEKSTRRSAIVQCESRAVLASSLCPEDYLAQSLSTKKRKELRRQARRLGEEGTLTTTRATTRADLADWAEEFLTLEAASWKGREHSALACDPAKARFFRALVADGGRASRIEGLSLRLDGRPVAMLATFMTAPGGFSFKTAFDEGFARFSPGVLLQKENLALLERGDIEWCDSCAAPDHPMIDHFWREQRTLVARNCAIGGHLRQAIGKLLIRYESRAKQIGASA